MSIDPSIILGVRPQQITAPDPIDRYARIAGLQTALGQGDLQQFQLHKAQREDAADERIRALFASNPGATSEQVMAVDPTKGMAYRKMELEGKKTQSEMSAHDATAAKARLETDISRFSHGAALLSKATDPQSFDTILRFGTTQGLFKPEEAAKMQDAVAQQGFSPQLMQTFAAGGMKEAERLKAEHDAGTLAETARGHDLTAATAREGHEVTTRGQNMVDARTRERLAYDRAQPKGQVVQTDQGLMLADPRAGTAQPMVGPNGQPLDKPLRPIPASANTGILENAQNLRRAEQALALVQGKTAGSAKGDTAATGFKGYLPGAILNRADPEGVETRAAIADLGSLIIHERSGAAVTASESPRLMPFIPLSTDDHETAVKKLKRFTEIYRDMSKNLDETYSKDQGYKPNPINQRGREPVQPAGGLRGQGILTPNADGSFNYGAPG